MATTVLIVDDHPTFRRFARRLLEDGGFDVVGEAVDARSAIAAADALRPELVLLDVLLPDESGLIVAGELAACPSPPVVVLTSSRSEADLGPALHEAPARGFVPKAELSPTVLRGMVSR
ncbi:MAG TPA: response regulator [Gaiella sp.]|jgi:DNA-binding NarL/FixJ family response regulator|nr:response regulator [Gaiella sp.]